MKNIALHAPGRADLPVGLDAQQRVPTRFKLPVRDSGIVEAHHELEDTTIYRRRREEAEDADSQSIRLLTSAATIPGEKCGLGQRKLSGRKRGNLQRARQSLSIGLNYPAQLVLVKWFGTHAEYDKQTF